MKLHLKGAHLVDPVRGIDESMDILIVDGIIEKIRKNITADRSYEVISLPGKIIAPGFMDMHVHLREPGYEHKETIATGCAAAAAGGFTAVCCMPNTNPVIDDESVVRYIQDTGKKATKGLVDVYPIAAATKGRQGEELAPIAELAEAGAVALSDDGSTIASAELMRRIFEYSSMFGLPVIQHAEEPTLAKGGVMNEGFQSTRLGLPGIPPIAEEIIVVRDCVLLRYVPHAKYHVAHVSTAGTVEVIRRAKANGLPITAEVTPHHISLTDTVVDGYDTNTKINPPLRTEEDIAALKDALRDGTIDVIASDHAPHTIDEKDVEYTIAPFGIVGLETAVGLSMTTLVTTGILTLYELVEKMSVNPRKIVGVGSILIQEGEKANFTFLDPECEWVVDINTFHSKSKNSLFHGWKLTGRAIGVMNGNSYTFFI
ncbi:MAG: dihydroorotase [Bacteroidetes bacterium]|nr:dihydroorotase [Bacteroidota bacterium]